MKRKINIGIIGRGKWGKRVIKVIRPISKILFIYGRNHNLKKFNKKIDWVFILSSNNSHYKLCKFYLKNKVNVFCEKPLTLNYLDALKLFKFAKSNKVILYVDDIEIFKNKKITFNKKNYVIREKKDSGTNLSLFERLFYHDAYLIYKKIFNKKFRVKFYNSKVLMFDFIFKKMVINFKYNIKSNRKLHNINKTNFLNFRGNPLKKMMLHVLSLRNIDLNNKERSLFALRTMLMIKKKFKNN